MPLRARLRCALVPEGALVSVLDRSCCGCLQISGKERHETARELQCSGKLPLVSCMSVGSRLHAHNKLQGCAHLLVKSLTLCAYAHTMQDTAVLPLIRGTGMLTLGSQQRNIDFEPEWRRKMHVFLDPAHASKKAKGAFQHPY